LTDKSKEYQLKRELEKLENMEGEGTELITIYIPPDKNLNDVMDQLRDEYGQAENIKSKSTRKNVQSALDVLMGKLKHFDKPPTKGMVMMAGKISTKGDKSEMKSIILEPPEKINSFRYHCDSNFLTEPLRNLIGTSKKIGLIVLDKREATIGLLKGNNIQSFKHLTSGVPGKTKAGGQSQARFERLRKIAAHEFFKRIASSANSIFKREEDLVGVIIGGPSPTKDKFIKKDLLHHEIEIIDKYDVSYTDEYGLRELVNSASETLEKIESMEQRDAAKNFLKKLVENEGLVTYGEEEVRRALKIGAVDKLLLSSDLRRSRLKIECCNCDFYKEESVDDLEKEKLKNEFSKCPKCSGSVNITEEDVIIELSDKAESMGGDTIVIDSDFEEGEQLKNAFGGIAAILRFKVR